jgi:hypothetical protein
MKKQPYKRKKFENRVRWDFKIAIHGYGRDVREALLDACETMTFDLANRYQISKEDLDLIEEHEVVLVTESDIAEEE